ncbi:hypothetical protein Tco_0420735 [Tanacetum coccineum]
MGSLRRRKIMETIKGQTISSRTKAGMTRTRDMDWKNKYSVSMLVSIRSMQSATSITLVTALCVVDVTKWVTLPGGNRPNPVLAIEGNRKQGNNGNQTRGRAFALGAAEAQQDLNIVAGTFSLNDHFATVYLILVLVIDLSLPTSCL